MNHVRFTPLESPSIDAGDGRNGKHQLLNEGGVKALTFLTSEVKSQLAYAKEGFMAGVNKVILIGNLGANPEVKYLNNGTTVANFRMATSENRVSRSGEKTTLTEWHRIVAFGRLAEICGEYLNKGKQVYIEGRLRTRTWEDKDGNKRSTTEIVATRMQMLGTPGPPAEVPDTGKDIDIDQEVPAGSDDDVPF